MPGDMADWHPRHGDFILGLESSLGISRVARYAHNRVEERGQYRVCCCAMIGHENREAVGVIAAVFYSRSRYGAQDRQKAVTVVLV